MIHNKMPKFDCPSLYCIFNLFYNCFFTIESQIYFVKMDIFKMSNFDIWNEKVEQGFCEFSL